MVREKAFYRTMFKIALPSAFQGLVSLLVVYLDDIMVSKITDPVITDIGQRALTGVGQTNAITNFFTAAVLGVTSGASVLISQYWGKRDEKHIRQVLPIAPTLSLLAAFVFIALALIMPTKLLTLVISTSGGDTSTVSLAVTYLTTVCFSYLPYAVSQSVVGMLRAVEVVKVTLYITVASLLTNLFFNWVLIFGHLGFPALGVRGAAVATVIARVIEMVITLFYLFRVQKAIKVRPRDLIKAPHEMWRDYRKYGLPVGIGDMQWSLVGLGKAAIIGHLTTATGMIATDIISANRIAESMMSLGMIFTNSLTAGACVIIAKSVGEKDYEKTRRYAGTIQIMFACIGVVMCTVVFLSRGFFVSTYGGLTDAARENARNMIALGALTLLGTTYHASCFVGINRGAGDGKFVMIVDMICGWLVVLPLSYLAAYVWKLGPALIFLFIRIDQCFKWLIAFIRLRGNRWIKNVTKD